MNLDRDERQQLRGLGWRVSRRKAKRPRRVRRKNVLGVVNEAESLLRDLEEWR